MNDFAVFDLETTGLDPVNSRICEISCLIAQGKPIEGEDEVYSSYKLWIVTQGTWLVNPGVPIPPETSAIHQICDEDVVDKMPIGHFVPGIEALSRDKICVAHNAQFERSFLDQYLPDRKWICTWKCALVVWPEAPSHSNEALRYWLKLGDQRGRDYRQMAHSAEHDTLVTSQLLEAILFNMSVEEAIKISSELARLPTCPIGKHKGDKWADVPLDYLKWLAYKAQDMREDVKQLALNEINNRLVKSITG